MAQSTDDLASGYVEDGEIQTRKLARTLLMSGVTGILAFWLGLLEAVLSAFAQMQDAVLAGIVAVLNRYFEVPVTMLQTAAETTAESLSVLGPFAYLAASASVALGFYALYVGVKSLV